MTSANVGPLPGTKHVLCQPGQRLSVWPERCICRAAAPSAPSACSLLPTDCSVRAPSTGSRHHHRTGAPPGTTEQGHHRTGAPPDGGSAVSLALLFRPYLVIGRRLRPTPPLRSISGASSSTFRATISTSFS